MHPEIDGVHQRYARRVARYDPWDPAVYMPRQEFERKTIGLLRAAGMFPPAGRRVLEVGCGHGGNLRFFLGLGFAPGNVVGNELQEDRLEAARAALPGDVRLAGGDATTLDLPDASFDIVFQSLVFSSILDPGFRQALADRMWALTRPGGGVLWYDFVYDNPANPDVRGVPMRAVRDLFPSREVTVRWLTLAPPLGRLVTRLHPALYPACNFVAPLRTHRLCWIAKS